MASGFLQITDIASYQLPPNIIDYCLLILGSSVGCRFADKTFKEIAKNSAHSFIATFLLVILGIVAAFAAGQVIDKNFFTLLLSYCPGGIYEVAVIAIFFDLDPEFVSFHHIIRLLMILFIVMGFNLFGDGIRDALDPKLSQGKLGRSKALTDLKKNFVFSERCSKSFLEVNDLTTKFIRNNYEIEAIKKIMFIIELSCFF